MTRDRVMPEAAWNLNLDVPVVSRHGAAVEQDFGATLFDRRGRGVRLTAAGQLVAEYVTSVLARDSRVRQQISDLQGLQSGILGIIGTDGAIASPIFPPFREGRADIGAGLNLETEAGVDIVSSLDDRLAGVMRADHARAFRESDPSRIGTISARNVRAQLGCRTGAANDRQAGGLVAALVTNSLEALKQFCSSDGHISLLCIHSIQAELSARSQAAVPLQSRSRPVAVRLDVCAASGVPQSFAVAALLEQLTVNAASITPKRRRPGILKAG